MIKLYEAIVLSIIQGITEWFPISSSGHLAVAQKIFGFSNLPFGVFLHLASIIAVIIIFRKDIKKLLNLSNLNNIKYLLLLLLGIIPAGLVGFYFNGFIKDLFSSLSSIGIFFILSGILIYLTKLSVAKKEKSGKITILDSIFIGIFQAFAILPGVSRSGATISSGLLRGLNKETAIKFSFLMSIPLVLAASIIEIPKISLSEINYFILIISFILTLLTSLFTIKILLKIIKSDNFYLFGFYNVILGLIIWITSFFI